MKLNKLYFAALLLMAGACTPTKLHLEIQNPTDQDRVTETIEIPVSEINSRLKTAQGNDFIIRDQAGQEIAWQLTSDQTVIFPITLKAGEHRHYTLTRGKSTPADTIAYGQVYPARFDDLAWENDKVSFRAYGPALQAKGEHGFGYDLFAKRGTDYPVLKEMYKKETDKALKMKIKELRVTDPERAKVLQQQKSYHIDHGYGMDCYAVGPTLGAGVAALLDEGQIVYPWCWKDVEFLDNGPLRFKVKLTFTPLEACGHEDLIETRIITLDAGARLNKTTITYEGLDTEEAIVSGIVLHDHNDAIRTEAESGWISYQDPTTGPGKGLLYLGHAVAGPLKDARVEYFSDEESAARNNAKGHVLAESVYEPAEGFTYWWGFGWSKADIPTYEDWNAYMTVFAAQLRHSLVITFR